MSPVCSATVCCPHSVVPRGSDPSDSCVGLDLLVIRMASVGGDVVEAAEPEPELEDAQEAAAVAKCQRLAAMVAQESGVAVGSPPEPVQCVVRLIVGFPGYQGGQGFGVNEWVSLIAKQITKLVL